MADGRRGRLKRVAAGSHADVGEVAAQPEPKAVEHFDGMAPEAAHLERHVAVDVGKAPVLRGDEIALSSGDDVWVFEAVGFACNEARLERVIAFLTFSRESRPIPKRSGIQNVLEGDGKSFASVCENPLPEEIAPLSRSVCRLGRTSPLFSHHFGGCRVGVSKRNAVCFGCAVLVVVGLPAAAATYRIGIVQLVEHPGLDASREGFLGRVAGYRLHRPGRGPLSKRGKRPFASYTDHQQLHQ